MGDVLKRMLKVVATNTVRENFFLRTSYLQIEIGEVVSALGTLTQEIERVRSTRAPPASLVHLHGRMSALTRQLLILNACVQAHIEHDFKRGGSSCPSEASMVLTNTSESKSEAGGSSPT